MPRLSKSKETVVDFVVGGATSDEWRLVLVEEEPWLDPIDVELRRIQDRLYDCLDVILDGHLTERFPEALGKRVVVQLDCYDLRREKVEAFFESFASSVFLQGDYRLALERQKYVQDISFAIDFDLLEKFSAPITAPPATATH